MRQALELARRGLYTTHPNPRVGCVLVRAGEVVGSGWHRRAGEAHAEVHALAQAGELARGATAYVTLEPCAHHGRTPPCADALIAAGVARVVVAMEDPFPQVAGAGLARLRAAGIAVDVGVEAAAAAELNAGFISRQTRQRPWIRVKLGVSLDGRCALADGRSQWITSAQARADVQHWRACSSAIVTGIGSVLADDPRLTVRLPDAREHGTPERIVLDSHFRLPARSRMLDEPGPILVGMDEETLLGAAAVADVQHTVTVYLVAPQTVSDADLRGWLSGVIAPGIEIRRVVPGQVHPPSPEPSAEAAFAGPVTLDLRAMLAIRTNAEFNAEFRGSPIQRARRRGLQRTAAHLLVNDLLARDTPVEERHDLASELASELTALADAETENPTLVDSLREAVARLDRLASD